jgi:uncharacterized protein
MEPQILMTQTESREPLKIAVVGAGISGVVAAHLFDRKHNVTLFEARDRLGGHTHTVVLPSGVDEGTPIDTGFIVLNDKTYPNFHRFLAGLGVSVRPSCMSFGYYCEGTGLAYAGTDLNGLFARRANLLSVPFWKMIWQIKKFSKFALDALARDEIGQVSLGSFLDRGKFGRFFQDHYLIPLSAAIWSCSDTGVLEFPAKTFVRFFQNHGLLAITDRPQWQTVVGGSHSYLRAFEKNFSGTIRLSSAVESIQRTPQGVLLKPIGGSYEEFDKVVIATHADQAYRLLVDPSPDEEALRAWSYSRNRTVLHSYSEVLPPNKRAWASWNYRRRSEASTFTPVSVTYHMNRLQGLQTQNQYCVTLNPQTAIPESSIVRDLEYCHPIYTRQAVQSQDTIRRASGQRHTFYCGAYLGNGFHEDGVNSALEVTRNFGLIL